MKVLHILRSRPDARSHELMLSLDESEHSRIIALFETTVDYSQLVAAVFDADRVICWW